ncbi:hypothetical protein Tco_1142003, partial [Tanacetum coccineum]
MKSKQDSLKTPPESPPLPPLPPPPSGASGAFCTTAASDSAQDPLLHHSLQQPIQMINVFMHEESDFEAQDMVSDDEDIGSRHVPRVNLNQDWFKPLSKDERLETYEHGWSIPSSSLPVPIHNWASTLASSYVPPPENSLLSQTGDI